MGNYKSRTHPEPLCTYPWVISKGKSESGVQRWTCKTCNISWTGNLAGRPHKTDITCPRCETGIVKKNGINRDRGEHGYQKWFCVSCKYNFERPLEDTSSQAM